MSDPQRPRPIVKLLAPGVHALCACGKSGTPPLCDASHGPEGGPVLHEVKGTHENVAWCTCGDSLRLPYCDGSHTRRWPEFHAKGGPS